MAVLTGMNKEGFVDKDHGIYEVSTETIMEKFSIDPTTYIDGYHGWVEKAGIIVKELV